MVSNFNNKSEYYRQFEISWVEPPMMSHGWVANVASNDLNLQKLIGPSAMVITSPNREAMIAESKRYIDGLLGSA